MQSIAGYPTDLTVTEPGALVTVNGVPLDVESVSVTRELSSSLPAQVTSASGITAATGSIEWNVGEDVANRSAHPWDGNEFPPKPSDEVVVFMGYGDVMARQLTGVIDSSNGSIAEGDVSSSVVDPIDKLNQPISFPAHLSVMPPHEENGPFLLVNNSPIFTTDRVLRACGFNATPPVDTGCILSVPLMGSAWPEVGRVDSASQQGFPAFPPSFNASHWGLAANSIEASYTPDLSNWPTGRLDKNLQITVKVRNVTSSDGTTAIRAWWGVTRVTLAITADRKIQAVGYDGTTAVTVAEMSTAAAWSADVFTLRVTPAGAFTIYASNGATATGAYTLPSTMTTTNLTRVQITGPHLTGPHIGGVQVGFSTAPTWTRPQTATLTPSASNLGLPAFPRIDGRNALAVLKEQAEAECASIWIDEFGVFRWVNRNQLTTAAPVATLTALEDLLDVGWESDASGVRSRVVLKYRQAAISRSDVSNMLAWQGGGGSMDGAQTNVQFAEPAADVDWIDVDEAPQLTADGTWLDRFNWGHGSWVGGIEESDTAESWAQLANAGFGATLEKLGLFAYQITTTAGTPSAGRTIELRTPTKAYSAGLRSSKAEMNLPILRAKAVVEWTDRTLTGAVFGPVNAAALEHEVGPWVQDAAALQAVADWLGEQVSAPRPVLRDVRVIPDFRRQLGDVVWVEDPENMRIRLRLLITKIGTTVAPGSAEQTISGRILEVQSYGPTNNQLDAHAAAFTNSGFDTLWADATNAQLDADPLGRG